ncbi:MAG TPA: caspase family protein, partial [Epsilonproteobacteria bacterium]|nr:caspase family protein [Campylobacterota bacterium]
MKTTKILLILLLFTLFVQAAADRSIYRKKYGKENKVALVIGNGHYTHFSPLKNTLNDAEDMRKILKSKGFDVLYLPDGDLRSMERIVRVFSGKLKQGGVGFFYYAGHGIEVDHKNYLIPVGSEIPKKDEVKYEALPVDMVIDKMESAKNRLNIIVLDACRNDPFSRGGGGLAQINNAKGMYVAFATAPGEVASDGGVGKNGLFTKYLVRYIDQPNLTLDQIFNKTRISVYEESSEKQLPWTSSSVMGEFYFQPGGSAAANISSRKTNNIKLIHFSHPKKEPRGLYIAQIKVNDIEKRYRIY